MKYLILIILAIQTVHAEDEPLAKAMGVEKSQMQKMLSKNDYCLVATGKFIDKAQNYYNPWVVCVYDGVQHKGQPNEMRGCMMSLLNLKDDKMMGFDRYGKWMPIAPGKSCHDEGFNEVLQRKYENVTAAFFLWGHSKVGTDLDLITASDDAFKAVAKDIKLNKGETKLKYKKPSLGDTLKSFF